MKRVKLRHLLIYLFLLQLVIPIPTLVWGEPLGILGGALIAAALTPLVALALSRMRRLLLRGVEEQVARLSFSAQGTPTGELWWLPILKAVGTCLTRGLGPVSFLLLLVCLSGILPELFYMLLVFFQLLYLLVILVMLGQAHPELSQMLMSILFRGRQRNEGPADPVIIVTDTAHDQALPGIPIEGPRTTPFQLGYGSDDCSGRNGLPAAVMLLLLPMPERRDDRVGLPGAPEQERS
jgi:hypothetical protein